MRTHTEHPSRNTERAFLITVLVTILLSIIIIFMSGFMLARSIYKTPYRIELPQNTAFISSDDLALR